MGFLHFVFWWQISHVNSWITAGLFNNLHFNKLRKFTNHENMITFIFFIAKVFSDGCPKDWPKLGDHCYQVFEGRDWERSWHAAWFFQIHILLNLPKIQISTNRPPVPYSDVGWLRPITDEYFSELNQNCSWSFKFYSIFQVLCWTLLGRTFVCRKCKVNSHERGFYNYFFCIIH